MEKSFVWLTHAEAGLETDRYSILLRNHHIAVVAAPLIEIEPISQNHLLEVLEPCTARSLAITSARAVSILDSALQAIPTLRSYYRGLPCYTLSGSSMTLARSLKWNIHDFNVWSAGDLAEELCSIRPPEPLLFPCSSIRRDELPKRLRQANVDIIELPTYSTHQPSACRLEEIARLWYKKKPAVVCFFSPSAAQTAIEGLSSLPWKQLRAVAIGENTARRQAELGVPDPAVAARPTPEAVLETVQRYVN